MNPRTIKVWVGLFIAAVAVSVTLTILIATREGEYAAQIQSALVENCEQNGNPLRLAVQEVLEEEIRQDENTRQLHEYFPQIPLSQLEEVLGGQIESKRRTIRRIAPVDCASIYNK